MKILYISPENTVGTLSLWKKEHEKNGHECKTITFFRSPKGFGEDICLDLPFNFTKPWMSNLRNNFYKLYRGKKGYQTEKEGYPPAWSPEGFFDKLFFDFKDWLWEPKVNQAIRNFNLFEYDVIHFESGMDFFKNEFFVEKLGKLNKKIICHYHGEDLRARGVMPIIDSLSSLNLTNELDLLFKHPNIHYLFLPIETENFELSPNEIFEKIRVAHAPTNREYKGSDIIIKVCNKLQSEGEIIFDLIENLPHQEALQRKKQANIFIDQVGDQGGWGYGMNSVESLSMGICTLTEMNKEYEKFIPDHPFISINQNTISSVLIDLIKDKNKIFAKGWESRKWVEKYHDIKEVSKCLYGYYKSIGLTL